MFFFRQHFFFFSVILCVLFSLLIPQIKIKATFVRFFLLDFCFCLKMLIFLLLADRFGERWLRIAVGAGPRLQILEGAECGVARAGGGGATTAPTLAGHVALAQRLRL